MIPKIICFIIGHKFKIKVQDKPYWEMSYPFSNVLLWSWKYQKRCSRCGKKLI